MMTLKTLEKKLQKADAKQAKLYLFCNFISLLLITAYSAMMFSPTVLLVLPQGGDSRKQMVAIFVLALFGCVVFTIYASGLFFRKKAKQLGTLMALGASGRRLLPGLFREVLTLSAVSSFLGIVAGFPFVWILWNCFNLISDSSQMALTFDFKCLYLSAVFFVIVVACSCLNAYRYLKKTNIMEVMHEEHRNEPVRELGRWCGPVG
ncbi:MAG: ABC transporter permease, partial [Lachnospiraceae bacterium]|nr:ABC transporter permease [Lachnospiraceae bacterium]